MKKLLKAVAVILGAALLLGCGAVALSHLVYGRSLKATLYELSLRRRFKNDRTAQEEIERLEARRAEGEKPYALPASLKLESDLRESERDGMQVFTLNGDGEGTIVLYLHGGAYINPFNGYQWRFMDKLTRATGCTTVAPAYHLAPWADYARAYDDLCGLYRDLLSQNPGRRLILMGDSAGGGLALGLAEDLAEQGETLPERLILFSPWTDVSMDNPDIEAYIPADPMLHFDLVKVHGQYWAGDADTHYWRVSPLFGDMTGLPPMTIYAGTRELLYPDILLTQQALVAAGVDSVLKVSRGLNHDWPLMPLPEADAAFREIASLVRESA